MPLGTNNKSNLQRHEIPFVYIKHWGFEANVEELLKQGYVCNCYEDYEMWSTCYRFTHPSHNLVYCVDIDRSIPQSGKSSFFEHAKVVFIGKAEKKAYTLADEMYLLEELARLQTLKKTKLPPKKDNVVELSYEKFMESLNAARN